MSQYWIYNHLDQSNGSRLTTLKGTVLHMSSRFKYFLKSVVRIYGQAIFSALISSEHITSQYL